MTDQPYSWLPVPEESEVPPAGRAIFDAMRAARGYVPRVVRAFALNGEHMGASFAYLIKLMAPDGALLSKREKEIIAVVVSVENTCLYCVASHRAQLATATGDEAFAHQVAINYRQVPALSARERALADFAVKLTRESATTQASDHDRLREHGLGDHEILEAIEVAAFFNYTNRLCSGLGLQPDPELLPRP